MRRALRTLAALLICSGVAARAATPVSITVNPSSGKASTSTTFQAVLTNTVPTPLTGATFTVPLSGAQAIQLAGATTSCGGTFSASGTTLTWSGGTLPGNATCTLRVPFQLPNAAGNNTISFPAGTLQTDQGSTNTFGSTQTYATVAINAPTVGPSPISLTPGTPQTVSINFSNQDTAPLRDMTYTLASTGMDFITPPSNLTVVCDDGSPGSATLSPDGLTFTVQLSQLAAGSRCTLNFQATARAVVASWKETVRGQEVVGSITQNLANTTAVYAPTLVSTSSDTGLNGRSASSVQLLTYQIPVNKTISGSKVGDVRGGVLVMDLAIKNIIQRPTRYTFTDTFPSFMTGVPNTTVTASGGAGCTAGIPGITFSGTTVNINITIPASTLCTYTLNVPLPTPFPVAQLGVFQNNVLSDVVVDVPQNPARDRINAYWRVLADGEINKYAVPTNNPTFREGVSVGQEFPIAWDLELSNNTNRDLTGITFDEPVRWLDFGLTTPATADLSASRSTCGGTLSLIGSGTGARVRFSGGTIPALGKCNVYLAVSGATFLPAGGRQNYGLILDTNATPTVTADNGVITAGNTSARYGLNANALSVSDISVPQGGRALLSAQYVNEANREDQVTLTIPFRGLFTLDTARSGTLTCGSTTVAVPASSLTVTAQGVSYPVTVPAAVASGTDATRYRTIRPSMCILQVPVLATTQGTSRFTPNSPSSLSYFSMAAQYTVTAAPTLSVSKQFSPSTIAAGQVSTVTVQLSSSGTSDTLYLSDTLPAGLNWVFTPNQPDGSFESSGYAACVASSSCSPNTQLIRYEPDGRTVRIARQISGNNQIESATLGTVRANTFGDLTNTITPSDVSANQGIRLPSAASASLKVAPNIALSKRFAPATIVRGEISTLSITLDNLNPTADTLGVDDPLPAQVQPVLPLVPGGTCSGTVTYDAPSHTLQIRGVTLASLARCTVTVPVTSSVIGSWTNTIPAGTVSAANGTNATAASAVLTVTPPPFQGCLVADQSSLTRPLLSPGSAPFLRTLTNSGVGTLTASGSTAPTWTPTLPAGYSANYQFGTAAASTDPQAAWSSWASASGGLAQGASVPLTVTVTSPAGRARGESVTTPLTVTPGTPNCGALTLNSTTTVIQAVPGTTKTQATCVLQPNGTPLCGPDTAQPLALKPCDVVRYTVVSTNSGDAPLKAVTLRDTLDAFLTPLGAGGQHSSGGPLRVQVDGGPWTVVDPATPPALNAARSLGLARDQNGVQANLNPGETLTLTLFGQVAGTCQTPALDPAAPWR